jgi:DNA-binding transcriptional regulator YdaS (Cro superfamily)
MIRTDQEYQEARRTFKEDLDHVEAQRREFVDMGLATDEIDRLMEPLLCFHDQLADEITWYENVSRGNVPPAKRLTDIGRILIATRIAGHLTQKELAERLGVSEAQVSRDERNEYHGVSVQRAEKILRAMGADASLKVVRPSLDEYAASNVHSDEELQPFSEPSVA